MFISIARSLVLPAALVWGLSACRSTPDAALAVDVDAKVLAGDRGEGILEVWIINARTGKKLEALMDGVSNSMRPVFSPDKSWLAVEDEFLDGFSSVRLFHHEANGGFRRIPEEDFLFGLLQGFYADNGLNEGNIVSSGITVGAWSANGKDLKLNFTATRNDGKVFKATSTLDLERLE
jgi:hypothetical protein